MPEFQVGDRVMLVYPKGWGEKGDLATVIGPNANWSEMMDVKWDDKRVGRSDGGFYKEMFVLAEPAPIAKVIENTVDFAFKNHSVDHLRNNLIVDLIDNLNKHFNIK